MKKYVLNISKLANYIGYTFGVGVEYQELVFEIANFMKISNHSLKRVVINNIGYAYVELYVINLIAMLNNSRTDITIDELVENDILKESELN